MPPAARTALPHAAWRESAQAHAARADALTATWREARDAGRRHAVEDFLFTYYPTRPGTLRRWHPGAGTVLEVAGTTSEGGSERLGWRWHTAAPFPAGSGPADGVTLDVAAFLADRGETVRWVRALVSATASRPGTFGCFGLHEWAMVYRDAATGRDHRHPLPLRLGAEGTDAVVESHRIACSHFDAFRFFTPEAHGLNTLRPTRPTQPTMEQPGCLHAAMDLYKWALKLGPAVPGDLLLDAFELARDVRYTDMQASPYDVSGLGLEAVAIESAAGKAEYVRRQRGFARRGQALRARLLTVCDTVDDAVTGRPR
ncbi:3-methyladenine DNA glycosylase [Xylanimonas allomyrinae]|uniref:3-methyladenine DNA glycosylase n=1 Tax=Xylanimonas allomyrinae TaxID=2509459 RepID=A0A4P6EKJ0_9MICO|nr:3-methyladenine DNA glycosylase [Xylanimonas allomyrinae]QAY63142.1 3-methyladenine DNA glycosylase [Xylanimonas allomyrinae]